MRMTNKIMQNNSLYNINQNKVLEDKLNSQMTNQSKIVRPSDDPVVAIRALRLRTNVTKITQYYEKNAEDADCWLSVTADALTTISDILTDLYTKAADSANKKWTSDDLEIFLTQMQSVTDEFYASGNVDYAGRFVFSGFRTDTPVTFTKEDAEEMDRTPVQYTIEENFDYHDISTISYTNYESLANEQQVSNTTLYRFRLAYDSLDDSEHNGFYATEPAMQREPKRNADGSVMTDGSGNILYTDTLVQDANTANDLNLVVSSLKDKAGNAIGGLKYVEYDEAEEAYAAIAADTTGKAVAYIPKTGELVFSEKLYQDLDDEQDFSVKYSKTSWAVDDINPVHYFKCTEYNTGSGRTVDYNATLEEVYDRVNDAYYYQNVYDNKQEIYYNVGFNQQIQVNTQTNEVFTHDVARDMDDFQHYLTQLRDIETKISDIGKKLEAEQEGTLNYEKLTLEKEAADKALTYIRENIHTKFENQITKYQNYMNDTNVAITNNAARGSRLDLISDRLMSQQETFKDLQTSNEGIDITQVAVQLTSAELTYNAALMATSKIMQTSLMNYI